MSVSSGGRPVDITLTVDGEESLYAGPGRQGKLRIRNTGDYGITLDARGDRPPGPDNHHVALFLPAGTLSATCLADLVVADGWALGRAQRRDGENHWDGLYLLHREGRSVAPGEEAVVLLHGLAADPGGSARHARVVAEYGLLHDGPMVGSALRGSRSLVLHVVPWPHRPSDLHLQATVVQGAAVVNRAAVPNKIVVGLGATAVDGLVRFAAGRTELRLTWDVGPAETKWWALCTAAEAQQCEVSVEWDAVGWLAGEPSTARPEVDREVWVSQTAAAWHITVPDDLALEDGQGIALVVDGLVTSHPSGPSNLYLTVAGVDDGGTGMFVLPVTKQPSTWSKSGGLTLYAEGDELFSVRGEFGQPEAAVVREIGLDGPGVQLQLFDDTGAVGAWLSSVGRSRIGHGLDVHGGLGLSSSVRLASRGRALSLSGGTGALDLVPPADGTDYTVEASAGRLRFGGSTHATGSVEATGDVVAGGGLTVNGPVRLPGEIHAASLRLSKGDHLLLSDGTADDLVVAARGGLNILSRLRVRGLPLLAVRTFQYQFGVDLSTGMRDTEWTPLVIGDRKITLAFPFPFPPYPQSYAENVTLVADGGRWHVDVRPPDEVPPELRVLLSGTASVTVLFIANGVL